jgi:hypothetical protein
MASAIAPEAPRQRRMRRLRIRPWSNSAKPKSLGEAGINRGTSCSTYVNHQSSAGGTDGCSNIIAVGLVYDPHVDRPYRCDGLSFFDHSIRPTFSRTSREQINICDTTGAAAGATGATGAGANWRRTADAKLGNFAIFAAIRRASSGLILIIVSFGQPWCK